MSKIYSNLDIIGGSGNTNSLTVDVNNFIVTSGGSVGVGVIPTEKFHVVGNTILDGTATITGNTRIDGTMGINVAPTTSKIKINETAAYTILEAEYNGNNRYILSVDGNLGGYDALYSANGVVTHARRGRASTVYYNITHDLGIAGDVEFMRYQTSGADTIFKMLYKTAGYGNFQIFDATDSTAKVNISAGQLNYIEGQEFELRGDPDTLTNDSVLNSDLLTISGYYDSDAGTGTTATKVFTTFQTIAEDTSGGYRLAVSVGGSERVSVAEDGLVGIGTVAPDEKLHVVGSIKMVDGNEALGKVFKSDANGVGSWELLEGGSLKSTSFVSKDGDDATGAVGDPDFPFLTIQAAIDPTPNLKTVFVYPGTYDGDVNYDASGSSATRIHLIDATINGDIEMKNLTYLTSQNKTGKVTGFITLNSPGSSVCYIRDLDEIFISGTGTENGISSGADNRLVNIDNVNKIIGDNVGTLMVSRTSLIRNVGLAEKINNVGTPSNHAIFSAGAPNRIENCNFNNTEVDGHMFITSTSYNTTFKNCQFECDGIMNRDANNFGSNEMTFINSSFKSVSQEIFNNTTINAKFFNCTFESNSGETYVFVDGGAGDKTLEFYNCISNKTLYDGGNGEFIVIENGNYVHSGFTVDHDFSTEQDT